MSIQQYEAEVAKFISIHSNPRASFYNTVEGIVGHKDIQKTIIKIMTILQKPYRFVEYESSHNPSVLLNTMAECMTNGELLFIFCKNTKFHPVIYDQLVQLRLENSFSTTMKNSHDVSLRDLQIHPNSRIFLVFLQENETTVNKEWYELTDHLLDLRKEIVYAN